MNPLQQKITQVIQDNIGNKITQELFAGLVSRIYSISENDKQEALQALREELKETDEEPKL